MYKYWNTSCDLSSKTLIFSAGCFLSSLADINLSISLDFDQSILFSYFYYYFISCSMTDMSSSRLIILNIMPSHIPNRSSINQNNNSNTNKSVTFSKVIVVNNQKTVYLMKHNQSPGTTRNIVNRFHLKTSGSHHNPNNKQLL